MLNIEEVARFFRAMYECEEADCDECKQKAGFTDENGNLACPANGYTCKDLKKQLYEIVSYGLFPAPWHKIEDVTAEEFTNLLTENIRPME